ncbi:MAG: redoxin domain-containing protein [Bacteroidales bacterium]|nr:redoxin domain-containing protein [Bacteroidales bacterium]
MAKLSYTVKRVVFTMLLFALLVPAKASGQTSPTLIPSGKYKITVDLAQEADHPLSKGATLYLKKMFWGAEKGVIIDSARLDKKLKASFIGPIFPIGQYPEKEPQLFTAGQYDICLDGEPLFSFLYSSMDGKNFKESFRAIPSEPGFQEYERVASKKEKKANENGIFLPVQFFSKLKTLQESEDENVSGKAKELSKRYEQTFLLQEAFRAKKDIPNSLICLMLNDLSLPDLKERVPIALADERILYTRFGKNSLDSRLMLSSLVPSVAQETADQYLKNKYLTYAPLKEATYKAVFDYFVNSKYMNDASTGVYVAKNYILKESDLDPALTAEAAYYVTVNEGTLVGNKLPSLSLKDTSGALRNINELMGESSIIYFYSDDCNYCKEETPKLIEILNNYTYSPLNLFTVYTGTDSLKWKEYVRENFSTTNPFIFQIHTADIARESNFPVSYGVTSTPKMFLADHNLRITGRNLKSSSLNQLLSREVLMGNIQEGILKAFFQEKEDFSQSDIDSALYRIDVIGNEKGVGNDLDFLRKTYLYLASSNYYPNQEAAAYLGEKICSQKEKWEDTVFTSRVCDAVRIFNMNKLGEKATEVQLYDIADLPASLLGGEGKIKVLFFYKTTCGVCTQMLESINKSYSKFGKKASFTGVYVGNNKSAWIQYVAKNNIKFRQLYDKEQLGSLAEKYDISSVPHIYLLDRDNTVIAKDISAEDLAAILEETIK